MIKRILAGWIMLLCFVLPVYSATYYVSKSGSNSGSPPPCSQATPCLTIAVGLGKLAAGDTLEIAAGTYTEAISYTSYPSGIDDSSHTIIRGKPGDTVVVNGSSGGITLNLSYRSYITIDNIIFDGVTETINLGIFTGGDSGGGWSHHILIQNCEVRNFKANQSGAITGGGGLSVHDLAFVNLNVHHNGTTGTVAPLSHGIYVTSLNVRIENCNVHHNPGNGIQVYWASSGITGTVIRSNRLHDNGSFGLTLGSGSFQTAYNNLIYGNGTGTQGSGGMRTNASCVNCEIYNNSLFGNYWNGLVINIGAGQVYVRNNIIEGNSNETTNDNTTLTTSSNNLCSTADTMCLGVTEAASTTFTNTAAADFTLKPGSKAIDTGYCLRLSCGGASDSVLTDFAGTDRPINGIYDIGGYEAGQISTVPGAPQNLRKINN